MAMFEIILEGFRKNVIFHFRSM